MTIRCRTTSRFWVPAVNPAAAAVKTWVPSVADVYRKLACDWPLLIITEVMSAVLAALRNVPGRLLLRLTDTSLVAVATSPLVPRSWMVISSEIFSSTTVCGELENTIAAGSF